MHGWRKSRYDECPAASFLGKIKPVGRQVNFYFFAEDMGHIEEWMRSRHQILCFKAVYQDEEVFPIEGVNTVPDHISWASGLVIVRTADAGNMVWKPFPRGYIVDTSRSPVLEFSRSRLREGVLLRGRIYFTTDYWDEKDQSVRPKAPDFVEWADSVLRWTRKNFEFEKSRRAYLSESVRKWMEGGGELRQFWSAAHRPQRD